MARECGYLESRDETASLETASRIFCPKYGLTMLAVLSRICTSRPAVTAAAEKVMSAAASGRARVAD